MRRVFLPSIGVIAVASMATGRPETSACTLAAERSLLLLQVEKDTTLPHAELAGEFMSASSVRRGPYDSLLAVAGTPMPGARVRLVQSDSSTQAALRAAGITARHPVVLIRAAPYRADCRTIRWTDSLPWVVRGDTGYARATLAPRSHWIAGAPLFVVRNAWSYPYPRQRSLAYDVPNDRPLASAAAMYSLNVLLEAGGPRMREFSIPSDTAMRGRVLEWAKSHLSDAELEPVRRLVWQTILAADWAAARRLPSRLRGSYVVTMESDGAQGTWYFRTAEHPSRGWPEGDRIRSTAELLASPHVFGYALVGYGAKARDSLLHSRPDFRTPFREVPYVWLAAADRPTAPDNDASSVMPGQLEFRMAVAPTQLWDVLDPFVRPLSSMDSIMLRRTPEYYTRENRQPRLPITLRLDRSGSVRADTTLSVNGKTLRLSLVRLDTNTVQ